MDEQKPPAIPLITDPEDLVGAIEQLIELVESGEVTSGALRLTGHDGTIEEIVFGDSAEERARMLERLRQHVRRGMH